jgi:hypothetical protein
VQFNGHMLAFGSLALAPNSLMVFDTLTLHLPYACTVFAACMCDPVRLVQFNGGMVAIGSLS